MKAPVCGVLRMLHRERRCHAKKIPKAIAGARNSQLASLRCIGIFVRVPGQVTQNKTVLTAVDAMQFGKMQIARIVSVDMCVS